MREHVFKEDGATWVAAVATCAQVLMCVVRLVGVMALHSRDALWTTLQLKWWVCR